MRTRASSSNSLNGATTGKRPINSGIKPYFIKSSGSTCLNKSVNVALSFSLLISAPKPMAVATLVRFSITLSKPANAPPQINRIFDVSMRNISCCGCLRPPCGGMDATVPSMSFNKACCTPSPETSRVMDGFSDLRVILSISSI